MAERTVSRVLRLRTAFSSGLAAGERGSGSGCPAAASGRPTGPAPRTAARTQAVHRPSVVAASAATPCRSKSRAGMEAEPDSPSRTFEPSRLTFSTVAMPSADLEIGRELLERRAAIAEIAGAGKRPALQPAQQLLDIPAHQRALPAGQAGGSVQGPRQRQHAVAGGIERHRRCRRGRRGGGTGRCRRDTCSRSTSTNCSCDLNSAPASDAASATMPLSTPPNACDSPTVTRSLPPRRLAATAVRPSLARAMRDVRRRKPQVEIAAGQAVDRQRHPIPVAFVVGQQADGGDVGRQIEFVGGERALQGLPAVGGEGEHALGDVAVELDIDGGQRDRSARHVGLGLEREAAEAAAGRAAGGRPSGRCRAAMARRPRACLRSSSVGCVLQLPSKANLTGAPVRRTFRPERSPASAAAKSASVIELSIGSSCQTKWPVAAKLFEIDGQASASSTLRKLSLMPRAASSQRDGAVVDADFGERGGVDRPVGLGAERTRQCIDQARPVGMAVVIEADVDARAHQRHVGDLDRGRRTAGRTASRAVSRSAASTGLVSSPSVTLAKLTEPVGNSDTATSPRSTRSSPVTLRISALVASRTVSTGISSAIARKRGNARHARRRRWRSLGA